MSGVGSGDIIWYLVSKDGSGLIGVRGDSVIWGKSILSGVQMRVARCRGVRWVWNSHRDNHNVCVQLVGLSVARHAQACQTLSDIGHMNTYICSETNQTIITSEQPEL